MLTNSATDADGPSEILTFSLDPGAPSGANIGAASGVLTWTPTDSQVGTNSFTVRVTDNGTPNLSDTTSFRAMVVARPELTISFTNEAAILAWSVLPGTSYRIQYKTNLTDTIWTDLVPDVAADGPVARATNGPVTATSSFYRLLAVP